MKLFALVCSITLEASCIGLTMPFCDDILSRKVGFFVLFSYTTPLEKFLVFIAVISAMANGGRPSRLHPLFQGLGGRRVRGCRGAQRPNRRGHCFQVSLHIARPSCCKCLSCHSSCKTALRPITIEGKTCLASMRYAPHQRPASFAALGHPIFVPIVCQVLRNGVLSHRFAQN